MSSIVTSTTTTNPPMIRCMLRMIVSYDGTRFHGFQRQMDNRAMNALYKQYSHLFYKSVPKRPHYEDYDHVNTQQQQQQRHPSCSSSLQQSLTFAAIAASGKRKVCSVSVQECIEVAVLDLCNHENIDTNIHPHFPGIPHTNSSNNGTYEQSNPKKRKKMENHNTNSDDNNENRWTVDDICLRFAGRTDKGVHAKGQVVTVYVPMSLLQTSSSSSSSRSRTNGSCCETIRKSLNSRLPVDISIQHIQLQDGQWKNNCNNNTTKKASYDNDRDLDNVLTGATITSHRNSTITEADTNSLAFDPRRCAKSKQYTYTIKYLRRRKRNVSQDKDDTNNNGNNHDDTNSSSCVHLIRHSLEDGPCLWVCPWELYDDDVSIIKSICQLFQGQEHDYTNFVHRHDRNKKNNSMVITCMKYNVLSETTIANNNHYMMISSKESATIVEKDHQKKANDDVDENNLVIVKGQFILEACSFRRTMVRNIVGFCIDLCRGRLSLPTIAIATSKTASTTTSERTTTPTSSLPLFRPNDEFAKTIHAAPASGLCLEWVSYND